MKLNDLKNRINHFMQLANDTYESVTVGSSTGHLSNELLRQLELGGLSFLEKVFGKEHIFYKGYISAFSSYYEHTRVQYAKGVLSAAKAEIDGGWLFEIKGIVSAEIFSDFIEMADHLLSEGYKDAAAVMIGSTLEEHLRQLCMRNGIPLVLTNPNKPGVETPKKADAMNAELVKAQVHNNLDQKHVTAWLGLRNSAAHGKYDEYTKEQVESMLHGVMNFITRTA
jgi:hypothetical protein